METIEYQDNTAGLSDVPGFQMSSTACDIRVAGDRERLDLTLLVSKHPAQAAGVFTQNDIKAAPVRLCQRNLNAIGTHRAILVNSGNANACTGQQGFADAETIQMTVADRVACPLESVFICSTGRIGRLLPMDRILSGIETVAASLSSTSEAGRAAAKAILTSDTQPKTATARFDWKGKTVTLAGMAKGAGMIEPNMATMLAFLATDAEVAKPLLQDLLAVAVKTSFNAITVDGDMSTNDTVLALAGGASGVRVAKTAPELVARFQEALTELCRRLAMKMVADGERVTKSVTLKIEGAPTVAAAEKVARAIGNSLLVKTSWFGNDPNWGRLIDAAGYARIGMIEDQIDLFYNEETVLQKGEVIERNAPKWKTVVEQPEFTIRLALGLGDASYTFYATDLSSGYVDFNKSE